MPRNAVRVLGAWLLSSLVSLAMLNAQGLPPQTRLAAVEIAGLQRLSKADLLKSLDLRVGSTITVAELEAAAERLAKSGTVSEVSFKYTFRGTELTAIYTVVEARASTVVVFDNFPWFAEDELTRAVAAKVPGFAGYASDSSQGIDEISRALSGLLKAKGVAGTVEYFPHLDAATGAPSHLFKVSGVSMPVCELAFEGVAPTLEDGVRAESAPLVGRQFSRNGSLEFQRATLTPFYRRRGHLRIRVLDVRGRMGAPGSPCATGVRLTTRVAEGLAYTWKSPTWAGNRSLAPSELDKLVGLKDGEVADGVKFDGGLKAVERAYRRIGYLRAGLTPEPRFEDGAAAVSFAVTVREGPQFVMGTLTVTGAPDAVAQRLRDLWKLKAGDVYDGEYSSSFVADAAKAEGPALSRLGLGPMKISTAPNDRTHTVDVTVRFGS